jgi:Gpi18-like mannosyltransferase
MAAALLYAWFWPVLTPDITLAYVPWLNHIQEAGPISAFATSFGDYTPPYYYVLAALSLLSGIVPDVTLVKLVGVLGTAWLTIAVHRLLCALDVADPWRIALFVPLLPGAVLNVSVMASADALWAAPCVLALACAADRRHLAMLIWCGVAFSTKQQAIFAAPFVLGLLLARRVPVRLWPAAPAAMLGMYLPAWAAGWSPSDFLTVYVRQAGFVDGMSLNAPNIWAIVQTVPGFDARVLTGVALATAAAAGVWLAARLAVMRVEGPALAAAALLAPLLIAGLLPRMHERYFFLADILALVWAGAAGTRRASGDAALVQLGSTLGILGYMSGIDGFACLGAVAMIVATRRVALALFSAEPANDNNPRLAPAV